MSKSLNLTVLNISAYSTNFQIVLIVSKSDSKFLVSLNIFCLYSINFQLTLIVS